MRANSLICLDPADTRLRRVTMKTIGIICPTSAHLTTWISIGQIIQATPIRSTRSKTRLG